MILNKIDAYREALKACRLDEAAMPLKRGYLVESVDLWNKVQKLLECPEFEKCHRFLYSLDVDSIKECDQKKVEDLYKLGVERKFISEIDDEDCDGEDCDNEETNEDENVVQTVVQDAPAVDQNVDHVTSLSQSTLPKATPVTKTCAYTCLYSAVKDGEIKTGEYYSNAISTRAAKAEAVANLTKLGCDNIKILAIEAGDPDAVCCDDDFEEVKENDKSDAEDKEQVQTQCNESKLSMDSADEFLDEESKDDSDPSKWGNMTDKVDEEDDELVDDKEDIEEDESEDKADDADSEDKVDEDEDSADKADDSEDKADVNEVKKVDFEKCFEDEDADADDKKDNVEEDEDGESDKDDKKEDLAPEKKAELRSEYTKAFRATMLKLGFEQCLNDLSVEDKAKFYAEFAKACPKEDVSKFMDSKDVDSFNKLVVKK